MLLEELLQAASLLPSRTLDQKLHQTSIERGFHCSVEAATSQRADIAPHGLVGLAARSPSQSLAD
eukprot:3412361-Amphidinium_carterae.1